MCASGENSCAMVKVGQISRAWESSSKKAGRKGQGEKKGQLIVIMAEDFKANAPLKNPRFEKFCQHYAIYMHMTHAAMAAGYSQKSAYNQGSRLMKRDDIRARVHAIQDNMATELGITEGSILKRLNEIADKCMQEGPVKQKDPETGTQVILGYKKMDSAGANRALELLGKQLGMFKDNINAEVHANFTEADRRLVEKMAARKGCLEDE